MNIHTMNNRYRAIFFFVLLASYAIPPAMAVETSVPPAVDRIIDLYARLRSARLDPRESYRVNRLLIKRKNASYFLQDGIISFYEPVRNIVTGAVFKGKGVFRFQADDKLESDQISRFWESPEVELPIQYVFFLFTDSTFHEIAHRAEKIESASGVDKLMSEYDSRIREYLYEDLCYDSAYRLAWDYLFPDGSGYFFADCQSEEKDRMRIRNFQFTYDPRGFENVTLSYYRLHRAGSPHHLLCSFRSDDPGRVLVPRCPTEYDFQLPRYTMEATVENSGRARIGTDILLEDRRGGTQFLIFSLSPGLLVESVAEGVNRVPVLFFRQTGRDGSLRLVLNSPMAGGEKRHLVITYSGNLLERSGSGQWRLKDFLNWYPRYGYNFRSEFDVTFHSPRRSVLAAAGKAVHASEDGKRRHSRWVLDKPVHIVTFNLGDFENTEFSRAGLPVLEIYGNPQIGGSSLKMLGERILDSMEYYGNIFAPYPFPGITITESPLAAGISFPGFINLSPRTIEWEEPGRGELIYAHEAAHQWWGHLVSWRTYHDIWLSEAFAEYSALLYLEKRRGFPERLADNLESKRERIYSRKKELRKAGPVWMGTRLADENRADYSLLIYAKGAYILHMLRHLFTNYRSADDSRFFNLLRECAVRYSWRSLSTRDFQDLAEQYYGDSLQWFFDQWIYGTALPVYKVEQSVERDSKGNWIIRGAVRQQDVPDGFKMIVPVEISFEGAAGIVENVLVANGETRYEIACPQGKPERIIFNRGNAVLCEIEEL